MASWLDSLFGTAGSLQGPQMFQMPGMGQAAGSLQGAIGNVGQTYGGLGGSILPQAQATAFQQYNNPFAQQAMTGAQTASGLGAAGAGTEFGVGASMVPYANQIFQQGMDPQNALYQRTAQTLQDQVRAGEAARGISTTPYGAGLENKAMSDFNIDWQNNQLQRMIAGGQGGGAVAGQGVGMMNQSAPDWLRSAMMPYATFSDIGQGQFGALQGLLGIGGQGANLAQLPVQDWTAYLGAGNQAGQVANQNFSNQLAQNKQNFGQWGQIAGGLGSALGMFI